jgi:hypothetical protein
MAQLGIKIADNFDILNYSMPSHVKGSLSGAPILSERLEIIGLHICTSSSNTLSSYGLASISWLLKDFTDTFLRH